MESTTLLTLEGGITKQILDEGDGELFPVAEQVVEIVYTGKLEDGTVFESNEDHEEPFTFVLGAGEVIKCWEIAVATMKKGELARIVCPAEYAYGESGNESGSVAGNTQVTFEIELVDFFDRCKVKWDYTPEERLEMAKQFKDTGNSHFRTGDLEEADFSYDQAIDYLDFGPNTEQQSKSLVGADEIRATAYLNQAAVYIKQEIWEKVVQNCNIVLRMQPTNVKAYFRRGSARLNQGYIEEAKKDLLIAQSLDSSNGEIAQSLKKIKVREGQEENKQKETWKRMFEKQYYENAKEIYLQFSNGSNPVVFLDIAIGSKPAQRIVIELFKNVAPRTVENFRALCTGEKGTFIDEQGNSASLHYKGSIVHRIVPEFVIQAGDFTHSDGSGGHSIYGPTFEDEGHKINHATRGLLSMFNKGKPNTSSSQFFITLRKAIWLDGKHVVFGAIIKNLEFLEELEAVECDAEKPTETVRIVDCGEIKKGQSTNE